VDYTQQPARILSLCTGSRGLERGLERSFGLLGWGEPDIAAYVEIGIFESYNLVRQMEQGMVAPRPVYTDVKTFPYHEFHKKVHGIIGGYPCQGFSHAGKRMGADDPRHLWPYIRSGVDAVRPVFCFFENVEGHLTLGFPEVYADLRAMGYTVEAGLFSAKEVGAPQQRKRLFILAIRNVADTDSLESRRRSREIKGETKAIERASQGENGERLRGEPCHGSKDVGNPDNSRSRTPSSEIDKNRETENKRREEQSFIRISRPSEELADTNQQGSQRRNSGIMQECTIKLSIRSRSPQLWPARPGEEQYEWEEPRATQPGLGVSVAGYNFRKDLLRMLGNSVVEQTAEKAFIHLLIKHYDRRIKKNHRGH